MFDRVNEKAQCTKNKKWTSTKQIFLVVSGKLEAQQNAKLAFMYKMDFLSETDTL